MSVKIKYRKQDYASNMEPRSSVVAPMGVPRMLNVKDFANAMLVTTLLPNTERTVIVIINVFRNTLMPILSKGLRDHYVIGSGAGSNERTVLSLERTASLDVHQRNLESTLSSSLRQG